MPNPENIQGHEFKEGESGNPAGRPKGSRNRSTIIREILELQEKVKNPITQKDETLTQEEIMTLAILSKARKGDVRAYEALMNSGYGAPKQSMEHNIMEPIKDVEIIRTNAKEDTGKPST